VVIFGWAGMHVIDMPVPTLGRTGGAGDLFPRAKNNFGPGGKNAQSAPKLMAGASILVKVGYHPITV
jgi:hypothetical protein